MSLVEGVRSTKIQRNKKISGSGVFMCLFQQRKRKFLAKENKPFKLPGLRGQLKRGMDHAVLTHLNSENVEVLTPAGKFPKLTNRRLSVQANTQCKNGAPRTGTMKKRKI